MSIRVGVIAALTALGLAACGQGSRATETTDSVVKAERKLDFPVPSATVTEPMERLEYIMSRYWDDMPWSDREAMSDSAFVEQSVVNFLEVVQLADSARRAAAFDDLFDRMDDHHASAPRGLVMEHIGNYLFSPDSPEYNLDSYAAWIDVVLGRGAVSKAEQDRLARHHELIMRNRPGEKATDFEIVMREGTMTTLGRLASAPSRDIDTQVILFFYDPDCDKCAEIEARLSADPRLSQAIEAGTVKFIAVDPFGTDYDEWYRHAVTLPQEWVVGYSPDGKVDEEELYLLNATPMVYLLAPDLTVLARDAKL